MKKAYLKTQSPMTKSPSVTILALETSCDETAASVVVGEENSVMVLSNRVSSQIKLHAIYGGVVPNLAAREHIANILLVIDQALQQSKKTPKDIDLLAVTNGPGLIPALLVGTDTAKTLSWIWKKPLLGIHHIEGHLYANFLENHTTKSPLLGTRSLPFPILALVVSGGHTQLMIITDHGKYEIIGQTQDDAVGEAFDKTARLLRLEYPGGPAIARCALQAEKSSRIFPDVRLPRPMIHSQDLNFSFSGIKTAVLMLTKKHQTDLSDTSFVNAVAREFQQACVDVLVSKTLKATDIFHPKSVVLAGGVSANIELRRQLGESLASKYPDIIYRTPSLEFCIDNAAMIATAAYFRWKNMSEQQRSSSVHSWKSLHADSNLRLARES